MKRIFWSLLTVCMLAAVMTVGTLAADASETFITAVEEANTNNGTVTLTENVILGEKLTITGNVTIVGEYTITRAEQYTGTLFAVNKDASLTLDGGVTIDGGNEWVMNHELYAEDIADWENAIPKTDSQKWFTPEENAPVATAYMITTSGTVNLKNVTVKNHYSTNGSGIVSASKGAVVTLSGAKIIHNASTNGSGLVVNASGGVWSREEELITVTMNKGTVIDGNHVGGNHGIFKIYMGTYFTMNGGEIKNTTGWNSNGVVVGIYHAVFTMNDGTICSNSSVYGPNNGRNAAIYGHSNHLVVINDGTICHNTGRSKAGVDSPYSEIGYTGSTTINGGAVVDNEIVGSWNNPDVSGGVTLEVNGGKYTQDVSAWAGENIGIIQNEEGYYVTSNDVAEVNGQTYPSIRAAIEAAGEGDTVTVLASSRVYDGAIEINKNITIDFGENAVYTRENNEPVFTILANVTVKNGDVRGQNNSNNIFVIGNEEVNGNLIIESGIYSTSSENIGAIVHVVNGTLTVYDGEFSAQDEGAPVFTTTESGNIILLGGTYENEESIEDFYEEGYTGYETENGIVIGKEGQIWITFANTDFSDILIDANTSVTRPEDPKQSYYIFNGWYADADCTELFDFTEVLRDDTVIYAKWIKSSNNSPFTSSGYGMFTDSLRMLFSQTYDIDVISTEGGTVTPKSGTNTVLYDRSITYTITPDEGYRIADVLYNGESVGAVTEYTAKRVKADGVLEVVFEMIPLEEETTEEPTPAEETEVA